MRSIKVDTFLNKSKGKVFAGDFKPYNDIAHKGRADQR